MKSVDKRITVEQIIEVSKMIHDSGIPSATSILLGTPDEDKEDIEETLKLMKKIKPDLFDVNSYIPLPGTPLYDSMGEEDRENIDWRKVAYKSFDNYFSKRISPDDFMRYTSEAYKIANKVRRKTIVRFGSRVLLHSIASKIKKSQK